MAKQTFENAMKRLEAIVQDLESGELSLDEAFKKFQEGVKLSKFCSNKLDETEKKVSILLKDDEGRVREEPFLPEDSEDV
ncbi:MAG: exodeoxyribonuclease VII small subunit [Deltaproteobacteria bacterium]|nr:exodeoxyribonuclease VII small subunit [Deltaproteobacteria bacterium]MBW2018427.1 exodeoxyribonuclease VII small subunit [Deltaproteobacteria bacterium]MBW2073714.1 exodeoxyribonuclease VII small subunit [Deltaproteobacteria bacterium]RLB83587.1 MAG: exodeoxyribonuclease VII small subunit [Deltaproteobacteria bacterium]